MKIKRRKKRAPEDSSASSDIAFLLIIYFIVIAGFNVNRGFLLNLPARDSTRLVQKDDLLRYYLDGRGDLAREGEARDLAAARAEIGSAIAARPNLALLLTVDPRTPWQKVVSFVELAQDLEVESFSFVMGDPPSGGGTP
ncbi:MAG: biopolymer transporter ExbD [Treponema sp.]|jgi:biopolymer transport protein ExbD|nr:biopolymer transporter ExbD [Treponema sp.]